MPQFALYNGTEQIRSKASGRIGFLEGAGVWSEEHQMFLHPWSWNFSSSEGWIPEGLVEVCGMGKLCS